MNRRIRWPLVSMVLLQAIVFTEAEAIPAFARRYHTSCQTCHVAFPKLNAFGETFRILGYHFPGETAGQIKQPDVALGAPAYARIWPKAVYPGAVPAHLPVAVVASFEVRGSSIHDGEEDREVTSDFVFPSEVAFPMAGSLGDLVSFFGEVSFEQDVEGDEIVSSGHVEHFDMRLIRPVARSVAFNLKIGAFQPELVKTFDHARRLTVTNYDSMFSVEPVALGGAREVGGGEESGGGIALPAIVRGFEAYGVVSHRGEWAVGVVNGLGPGQDGFDANSSKDVYARLGYKWGGLAPDGSNATTLGGSGKSWQEQSIRLGVFGYSGNGGDRFSPATASPGTGLPASLLLEDDSFRRLGFDVSGTYKDLNVFGAFVSGRDSLRGYLPSVDDPEEPTERVPDADSDCTYTAWFVEGDAVLHLPWLVGAVRYETVNFPDGARVPPVDDWQRGTASITALVRANVKTTLELTRDLGGSGDSWYWLSFSIAF